MKRFSCSAQLRLKFILLINVKMPTIVCWHFNIYKQDKLQALVILKVVRLTPLKRKSKKKIMFFFVFF